MGSIHHHRVSHRASLNHRRGFTLVELLVVLLIITIVTMTVLTGQGSFNKSLLLANTAYDLALTLRYTETYGLSSRVGTTANIGYGLHFAKSSTITSFTLFADTNPPVGLVGHDPLTSPSPCHPAPGYDATGPSAVAGDCIYNSSAYPGDSVLQTYTLNNGITIKEFCATVASGATTCSSVHSGMVGTLTSLDIVFARPNPVAFLTQTKSGASLPATKACITLQSLQSTAIIPSSYKYLWVDSSGQISVSQTTCP